LEVQRRDKVIGSSLEAGVRIHANRDTYDLLKQYEQDLPSIFIVSRVELKQDPRHAPTPDFSIEVVKAQDKKCERCWNYRDSVGSFQDHPTLCDRCIEAIQ